MNVLPPIHVTTNNNYEKGMFLHKSMTLQTIFKYSTNWMTCNNRWWTSDSSECYRFEQRPFTTIVYNEILFRSLYFSHSFYKTWICFLAMMYQYRADPWPKCHYSSQIDLWAKFSKAHLMAKCIVIETLVWLCFSFQSVIVMGKAHITKRNVPLSLKKSLVMGV